MTASAPPHASIVERLRWRVGHHPGARALTFLSPRGVPDESWDYAELDRRARRIAAELQTRTEPGDRAVLLFAPGLDYVAAFFGCLYADVIAVPAYPPQGARQLPRLESIVADAAPRVALTTSETQRRAGGTLDALRVGIDFIVTDAIAPGAEEAWRPITPDGEAIAFLQYTSGSTGVPKGAMVRHANLMHNSEAIYQAFGHGPDSVSLLWVPPYHDMGLIGGIVQPLYGGFPGVLMSPLAFFKNPIGWLKAIERHQATSSGGPNFAYELCARRAKPEDVASLDLSAWRVAFNGAEPVRAETITHFADVFAPAGYRPEAHLPCYGLAEATLLVSSGPVHVDVVHAESLAAHHVEFAGPTDKDAALLVTSGVSALDHDLRIVDPETSEACPCGHVGEIWLASPGVAAGYWQRPAETEATFSATIAGTHEGPFLRTGDLGYLCDGRLVVTGRLKDMIILSGRNHYPQDVEWTVERAHPALRLGGGAAFTVPAPDRPEAEALVVAQEWEGALPSVDELDRAIGAIRRAVSSDHDMEAIAVLLLPSGAMPKTSSGKVRRSACRAAYLDGSLPTVAAWQEDRT